MTETPTLSPEGFLEKRSHYVLIDVRRPEEYQSGHVSGALLMPLGETLQSFLRTQGDPQKTYVFMCGGGMRSARATDLAQEFGLQAYNLEGGIRLWKQKGFPVSVNDDG